MHFVTRTTLTVAATIALAAGCVTGAATAAPATTPSPAPTPPVPTAAPTAGPAAPVPSTSNAPEPAPVRSPLSAGAASNGNPTLAEMNAAGNHSMGSTIATYDPNSAAHTTRSFSTESLSPLALPSGVDGLDVSGWQVLNAADWRTIYANGARFVYTKATESTDYRSSQFAEQYNDSLAAGLLHGAYHFAQPGDSSGAAQANFFVNNGGGWTADGNTLPPLLDIEYNTNGPTCYNLSRAAMVSWIADFSNTVWARTGRLPAIYTTTDWWGQCTGNTAAFSANPLFIARYPSNISSGAGTLPAGWAKYTIWQYASSGIFPGDQDVFNGTLAQLQAFARGVGTPLKAPVIAAGDITGDGKPDVLARKPDGSMWLYKGTGSVNASNPGLAASVLVGSGWNMFDSIVGVSDFNGDKKPDLIARKPDGTLWFYAGTGHASSISDPGYLPGVRIGASGWEAYSDIIASGDLNGDGKPDLLARKPDGSLWFYAGTGVVSSSQQGYQPGFQFNTGWNAYSQVIGAGDINRDGHADLLALRSDGTLWSYYGSGTTTGPSAWFSSATRINAAAISGSDTLTAPGDLNSDGSVDLLAKTTAGELKFLNGANIPQSGMNSGVSLGYGWNMYKRVWGAGDLTGDGKSDLLGVKPDGTLWIYAGTSSAGADAGYRPAQKIGSSSWTAYSRLLNAADVDGDGKSDVIGIRPDGTMWLYSGTAALNGTSTLRPGKQINSGWQIYVNLIAGDFTGDGKSDLVGSRADGSLWLYAGTQKTSGTDAYYRGAVRIGTSGWSAYNNLVSVGDLNGDGKPDFVATRPDGALWYYAGTGTADAAHEGYAAGAQIGTGWGVYSSLIGTGDVSGDKRADLVGVRPDGTMWFYAGTGGTGVFLPGFASVVSLGWGWQVFA